MKTITVEEIIGLLGADTCKVRGDSKASASGPAPLFNGPEGGLSFHDIKRFPDFQKVLNESRSTIILTNCEDEIGVQKGRAFIIVPKPRYAFVKILDTFSKHDGQAGSVHPTAVIDPQAKIDSSAKIGPFCIIGRCKIGKDANIEARATIGDNVTIGNDVRIKAGVVLGNDGFSFEREKNGRLMRFPHTGGMVIEDHVEIGSNTVIDRGTFGNTLIGEGTKIDNLCHIAHNVQIGKHCMIISNANICGSCRIGDRTVLAPNVVIMDGLTIGSNVRISMGTVVIKDIEDDSVVYGNPGRVTGKNV